MVRLANIRNIKNGLKETLSHAAEYFLIGTNKKGDGKYPLARLKMDIIGEETFTADSDVTDHYVESNTAYQDQISLKPKIFTIQGEVGELVWYQKDQDEQGLGQLAQRLEGVISFLPIRSKSFTQMKSKAMKALQWVDTASNVLSKLNTLSDGLSQGKQQSAFVHLCQYRDDREVLTIQTPWGFLSGYVITNLKFTQPKETKDKTHISITFKEFRTTHLGFVDFDPDKYQGNAAYENQPEVDNGTTSGDVETIAEYTEVDPISGKERKVCPVEYDGVVYKTYWDDAAESYIIEDSTGAIEPGNASYVPIIKKMAIKCKDKIGNTETAKGSKI